MYRVEFLSSAAKEFRSLDAEIKQRIIPVIDKLIENPRPKGVRKLHQHKDLYRNLPPNQKDLPSAHSASLVSATNGW
jgi:hypothetical protein